MVNDFVVNERHAIQESDSFVTDADSTDEWVMLESSDLEWLLFFCTTLSSDVRGGVYVAFWYTAALFKSEIEYLKRGLRLAGEKLNWCGVKQNVQIDCVVTTIYLLQSVFDHSDGGFRNHFYMFDLSASKAYVESSELEDSGDWWSVKQSQLSFSILGPGSVDGLQPSPWV